DVFVEPGKLVEISAVADPDFDNSTAYQVLERIQYPAGIVDRAPHGRRVSRASGWRPLALLHDLSSSHGRYSSTCIERNDVLGLTLGGDEAADNDDLDRITQTRKDLFRPGYRIGDGVDLVTNWNDERNHDQLLFGSVAPQVRDYLAGDQLRARVG